MPCVNVSITFWAHKGFETFEKPHLQRNQEDASSSLCVKEALCKQRYWTWKFFFLKEKSQLRLKKNVSQALYQCYLVKRDNI